MSCNDALLFSLNIGDLRKLYLEVYNDHVQFTNGINVILRLTLLQWRLFCDEMDVLNVGIERIAHGQLANFCTRLSGQLVLELRHPYCCIVLKSYAETSDYLTHTFVGVAMHYREWNALRDGMASVNHHFDLNLQIPCYARGNHRTLEELEACCFCDGSLL